MSENTDLTYYQKKRDVILNRAKDYYKNNKERLRVQVRDKYRNLSEKKKENMVRINITICHEEKKQRLKEYHKNYQKNYRDTKKSQYNI